MQASQRRTGMKRRLEQSIAEHEAELDEAQAAAAEKRRRRKLKRRHKAEGVVRLRDEEAKERRGGDRRKREDAVGGEVESLRLLQDAGTQKFGGVRARKRRKMATEVMDECNGERECG